MPAETVHHPSQSQALEKPRFVVGKDGIEDDAHGGSVEKADSIEAGMQVETHEKALELIVPAVERAEGAAERANSRIDALEIQLELLNREREMRDNLEKRGGLAEDQPRRVRKQDGVTEKLVKYADGTFGWQVTDVDADFTTAKEATFAEGPGKEAEVHGKGAIDAEIVDDEEIIEAEIVEDDDEISRQTTGYRPEQAPIDIGELKVLEAAPVRKAIEAAPEAEPFNFDIEENRELFDKLSGAADKYAGETAKKRNAFLGRFLRGPGMFTTGLFAKIPRLNTISETLKDKLGFNKLAEKANDRLDKALDESRLNFEANSNAFVDEYIRQLSESVSDEERESKAFQTQLKLKKLELRAGSMNDLDALICEKRSDISGNPRAKGLTQFWMNRNGMKGTAVKAGTVLGTGFAVGTLAGLTGLGGAGAVLGGAAGFGIGYHVTKNRANAVVDQTTNTETGAVSNRTLAERQRDEAIAERQRYIEGREGSEEEISIEDLTSATEAATTAEIKGNRGRLRSATGIAALGGGLGGLAGEALKNIGDVSATPGPEKVVSETIQPTPEVQVTPEFSGMNFDIQGGSGFTQELMDFAQANGHSLSPDQAYELFQNLQGQFGNFIQNADGSPISTYLEGGDLRISAPGTGQISADVANAIKGYMSAKGLW